ncbi:YolD-like family protein [Sutcliffiella cohnii]
MIKDRGTIKWTAMMLPEHVKMIRNLAIEDEYVTKPELDEQQLELLNEKIGEAMEFGSEVTIHYFEDHEIKSIVGNIHYADPVKRRLHVVTGEEVVYLKLDGVINIQS